MQSSIHIRRDGFSEIWPLGNDVEDVAERLHRTWNAVLKRDKDDLILGIDQGIKVNEWFNTLPKEGFGRTYRYSRVVKQKDRMQAIHMATYYKWYEGVEILLKADAQVNEPDYRSASITHPDTTCFTPLLYACYEGRLPLVKLLIDHGADVHYKDPESQSTPMSITLRSFSFPIIGLLHSKGATIEASDVTPVSMEDVIQAFNDPAMKVPRSRHIPNDELEEKVEQVKEISLTVLRLGLENGADPNKIMSEGMPAFHTSIQGFTGDLRCMELLVEFGADVESVYEAAYTYRYTHLTPIFAAALNPHGIKAVHWLLQQGVELDVDFQPRYRSQNLGKPCSMLRNLVEEEDLGEQVFALVTAGCHVSQHDLSRIKESLNTLIYRQETYLEMTGTKHPVLESGLVITAEMIEFLSQPKPLQWTVRTALRRNLKLRKQKDILQLPLPGALRKYLMCYGL